MKNKVLKTLYILSLIGGFSSVLLLEERPAWALIQLSICVVYFLCYEIANAE